MIRRLLVFFAAAMVWWGCIGSVSYGATQKLRLPAQIQKFWRGYALPKKVAPLLVAVGLALGAPAVMAQEDGGAVEWQRVDEHSDEHLHSVFYLLANDHNDPEASPLMLHALYVGENEHGDALLIGFSLEDRGEMEVDLYGYDGLVAAGVQLEEYRFFENMFIKGDDISVLAVRGLNLSDAYSAAQLENYPFTKIGRPLQLATYGLSEEAIADYVNLNLNSRQNCASTESLGWARIGIGLHTCDAQGENIGAAIFNPKTGHAMGIWAGKGREFWLVQEYFDEVIEMVNGMESLSVSAAGKLPTLWAKLKAYY